MYSYYTLRAVIKVKNSTYVMHVMSCNWEFGHATKSKGSANQWCEKTFRAFTRCLHYADVAFLAEGVSG